MDQTEKELKELEQLRNQNQQPRIDPELAKRIAREAAAEVRLLEPDPRTITISPPLV